MPGGDAVAYGSWGHEVLEGMRLSVAAGLGMVPLGIAFGLLVVQSGLSWWMAPALSLFAYAGSLELLLITLLTSMAPLLTIAMATLLINFRHVFYALSFPLHVVRNRAAKLYSMYALTDEAYAITAASPHAWTAPRLIALQVSLQGYWLGGGLVGVLLGSLLPAQIRGLDFAMCALFITLTLDAVRTVQQVPSLLLAATAFALGIVVVPGQPLFAAMIAFMGFLTVRYCVMRCTRIRTGHVERSLR